MLQREIINRFISRFDDKIMPTITSIKFNENNKSPFSLLIGDRQLIQIYHCIRSEYYEEISKKIFTDGFIANIGNKGYGVYLASHAQYARYWGGNNHVLVCDVIVDPKYVNRFISEVYSGVNNWEYVVSDPKLIYPVCLIKFECKRNCRERNWTNGMCPNCFDEASQDPEYTRRCDCKHYPIAHPDDIISNNYEVPLCNLFCGLYC